MPGGLRAFDEAWPPWGDMDDRELGVMQNDRHREEFEKTVGRKESRKLRARRRGDRTIWQGFGAFGVVGWSVAVPTLVGVGLGLWIDATWPSRFSWTLMLGFAGIIVGCLNAWQWVTKERREIEREREENGD